MTNKQKADLVAWLHLSLILLGIVSLPLIYLIDGWNIVVFVLVGVSIFSWVVDKGTCWITRLENKYRKHNNANYEAGFIQYYLYKFFSIKATKKTIDILLYGYVSLLIISGIIKFI